MMSEQNTFKPDGDYPNLSLEVFTLKLTVT